MGNKRSEITVPTGFPQATGAFDRLLATEVNFFATITN